MTADELRKLAEAATPGPWHAYPADHQRAHDDDLLPIFVIGPERFHTVAQVRPGNSDDDLPAQTEPNAKLIAACDPTTIIALLDERDRLLSALEQAHQWAATAVCVESGEKLMPRKIIQVVTDNSDGLWALCDDGTLWMMVNSGKRWQRCVSIPQDDKPERLAGGWPDGVGI